MEIEIKKFDLIKLKLRNDNPTTEDHFEEKTHEQVANILIKLITEQEGGFAIGLEGSWGSGKSTVTKITEQKIKESAKDRDRFVFYTFDTWAHQGDPIRRSFLECFAGTLYTSKILRKKKWAKLVRKFRAQTKKVSTSSTPKVTVFNYLMAFYALLAPFVFLYSGSLIRQEMFPEAISATAVFIFLIILTSLLTYIFRQARNLDTKNLPVIPSFRYLNEHTISEQYVETEDATTIEFNKYFDRLIKLVHNRNKKVVVILDNLDRISSNDFISMWGTMRNFFTADNNSEREKLLRNVYLIVPFDQKHINEIFTNTSHKFSSEITVDDKVPEQLIGEEFIDKTFRFVLDVAPPITTNWKSFFNRELRKSFGDQLVEQELHDLQKLFDIYHSHQNKPITPRRIKNFINDLILQLYERNGEIPLKYLALYVLYKNEIKMNPNGILNQEIFNQRTKDYFEGEDWIQNVAAAHYKVEPNNALQLVLGNRIMSALVNNEYGKLEQLQEHIGFNYALTKVIIDNAEEWAKSEPISFAKVANTIGKVEFNSEPLKTEIWKILAVNTKHIKNLLIHNETVGLGLANIISNARGILIKKSINQICSKISHNKIEAVTAEKYSNDFFEFLLKLNSSIVSRLGIEKSKSYLSKIKLPNDSKTIIHLASLFYNQKEIQFGNYNLNPSSSKNIQGEFLNRIDKLSLDVLEKSLVTFYKSGMPLNWKAIADKLNNRLLQNKVLESHEYESLLNMLSFLKFSNVDKAQTHVTNLTKSGFLLGVFNKSGDSEKLKAILVFYYLAHYKKVEKISIQNNVSPFGRVNANKLVQIFNTPDEYPDLVDQLADLIKNYNQLPQLLKMISDNPNKNEFLINVFKRLLDEGYLRGLDINHVLNHYNGLNLDGEENNVNIFFNVLDEESLDVNEIDNLMQIKEDVLEASISSGSKLGSDLYNRCKNLFSNLSKEGWFNEFKNEGHILKLVRVLFELDRQSFINRVDFRDALLDYTEQVLFCNGQPKSISSNVWSSLPKAMSKTNRESFYKILYAKLISDFRTSEISYNVLRYYGDEFSESLNPTVRPDKFVENVLLDLINSNVKERLDWIIKNHAILKRFLKKSGKETQSKIKDAINSKDGVEEDIESRVKRIKKTLELE